MYRHATGSGEGEVDVVDQYFRSYNRAACVLGIQSANGMLTFERTKF
jgi:hypothetical protein